LEIISKQAGIAELEWQHQRKQLLKAMNTVSLKKPFASKEKPPSFGIPINACRPVITPDAFLLLIK
jgi:hypothetical protein